LAAGTNPEILTHSWRVFLDSGFAAARRPGMMEEFFGILLG
jgi:hypothetical protein